MGIVQSFLRFLGFQEHGEGMVLDYKPRYGTPAEPEVLEHPKFTDFAKTDESLSKFNSLAFQSNPQREIKVSIVRPELGKYGKINYSLYVYTENLKEGYLLLVDVSKLLTQSRDEARRVVNFLSGVTEALGGARKEVVRDLYLFVPPGVTLYGSHSSDY